MIRKNLDLIIVAFIMMSLILYEETFELIEEALHLVFEGLHVMFEWVELGVEKVVDHLIEALEVGEIFEYLFITERHGSQFVTFWFLMSIIGYGLFRFAKTTPRYYEILKRATLMSWIRRKTQFQLYWHSLTQMHKAALVATAVGVTILASFFVI